MVTSTEPVEVKQYPMPHTMTEEMKKVAMKMIEMDVIERSESPYSFPIVIAKKTDGTNWCCIDLRPLNNYHFDTDTMPNSEDMFALCFRL